MLHIIEAIIILFSRGGKFRGKELSLEENFAGGKFREIPFAVDIIFAGSRKIQIRENSENLLHAKNWCYTVHHRDLPFILHTRGHVKKTKAQSMGVDHGGMRGMHPPYDRSGGMTCTITPPPYKEDEQMKSILHNTQIITPEEMVSYIDDEIIFPRKFE